MTGLIIKGIGGFYYVESGGRLFTCKARGIFRKKGITPLAGDRVEFTLAEDENGTIDEILPRKNLLVRPPVANLDKLFIVASAQDPAPNTLIIDKTIAAAEIKGIEPVLIVTKTDFGNWEYLRDIYSTVGIKALYVSAVKSDGIESVRQLLRASVSAFTGNSGAGKSTLLNALFPELYLETGEISKKLGRGRHTTRHVELFKTEGDGYVADTPGFSTMDMERYELADKDEIILGFREFEPFVQNCKFSSCSHTGEKGCAVKKAADDGEISRSRLESYISMYNEVKDVKQWQIQKNV